jgi:ankyrin repeat protein
MDKFPFLLVFLISISLWAEDRPLGDQFAIAIESGDLDKIKGLVEGGAKADTLIEYGEHKITPLMKACWDGHMEIATYLMDQGADVNAADESGTTSLSNAIQRDRPAFVQLLIDRGAKLNVKDSRQFTPLTQAAAAGNDEVLRILVKAGADLKAETYGLTPLMFAVASRKIPVV